MTDALRRSTREETPPPAERRAFARFEATGWRAQLPLAALAFIILASLHVEIHAMHTRLERDALARSPRP